MLILFMQSTISTVYRRNNDTLCEIMCALCLVLISYDMVSFLILKKSQALSQSVGVTFQTVMMLYIIIITANNIW